MKMSDPSNENPRLSFEAILLTALGLSPTGALDPKIDLRKRPVSVEFDPAAAGVVLPGRVKETFRDNIILVFQNMVSDLKYKDERILAVLSFGGVPCPIAIPIGAIHTIRVTADSGATIQFSAQPASAEPAAPASAKILQFKPRK